jgi:hypothetical protein
LIAIYVNNRNEVLVSQSQAFLKQIKQAIQPERQDKKETMKVDEELEKRKLLAKAKM